MKSSLSTALGCFAFIAAFVGIALVIGSSGGRDGEYFLDLVNRSSKDAVVQVSDLKEPIVLKAEEIRIFHVEEQDKKRFGEEREFTIKSGDRTDKIKSKVVYRGHTVVDVTGDTNVVMVDYGRMYRPADTDLAPKEKDAVIVAKFKHPARVYPVDVMDPADKEHHYSIKYGLGETLPKSIKVSRVGKRKYPEVVRLLVVPGDVIDRVEVLDDYVRTH